MKDLALVLAQEAPLPGDPEGNLRRVAGILEEEREAGLVALPELFLTGYALGGRARELARRPEEVLPPVSVPGPPVAAMGFVERGEEELVYNSALVLRGPELLARHRKVYLPTYGLFDEGRTFARGRRAPPVFPVDDTWRAALLLCEDFWHPALLYLAACRGADLLLVLAAAPGREPPEDPTAPLHFASQDAWELLGRAAAVQYGVYVAVVNRVGVEGALAFAGGSFVVAPDGTLAARAPHGEPARLRLRLSREALRAGRTPFAHLRDEDPELLHRELGRILRGDG